MDVGTPSRLGLPPSRLGLLKPFVPRVCTEIWGMSSKDVIAYHTMHGPNYRTRIVRRVQHILWVANRSTENADYRRLLIL